jgi:hypothetical protein
MQPVWRDKANFIIHARLGPDDLPKRWEQLWARKIDENSFEICCIPAFVYDLALGDVVETWPTEGKKYVVQRVIEGSGRFTFRVWFGGVQDLAVRGQVCEQLLGLGCHVEWYSASLLCIDAGANLAQTVADMLQQWQQTSPLVYESGKTD